MMIFLRNRGILPLFFFVIIGVVAINFSVSAADWKPEKTIRLIVTDKAGAYYDAQARIIAKEMSSLFDKPVIVENLSGAGMMMGTIKVYRSKPDGYTIGYTSSAALLVNQIFKKAQYDQSKFTYLGQTLNSSKSPSAFITTAKKGLASIEEVLKLDRPFRFGTPGPGSIGDISPKAISHYFGFKDPIYVTYPGPEIVPAVIRGECDGAIMPIFMADQFIKTGELDLIMAVGMSRYNEFPDVRCLKDLGHTEIENLLQNYHIIIAPPDLPDDIYDVLSKAVYKAVTSDSLKEYHKKALFDGLMYLPATGPETKENVAESFKALESNIEILK
ncbi:MAG: hypothetical protein JW882_18200 [Deltaproteobacteria bacterium]|nr:hypothetical protein [Deltaproteobacteria bacterium]